MTCVISGWKHFRAINNSVFSSCGNQEACQLPLIFEIPKIQAAWNAELTRGQLPGSITKTVVGFTLNAN